MKPLSATISILFMSAVASLADDDAGFAEIGEHSLAEAILWHGGEAEASVIQYQALPKAQRDALEAFLWDL